MAERVVIAYGGNQGDSVAHVNQAINAITHFSNLVQSSSNYASKAEGFESENTFINGCLTIETDLQPLELLQHLKAIEAEHGRTYSKEGYEDRPIDLDIIFFGNTELETSSLELPHPRYAERGFVTIPIIELFDSLTPYQKAHFTKSIQQQVNNYSKHVDLNKQLKQLYFIDDFVATHLKGNQEFIKRFYSIYPNLSLLD